MAGKWTVREEGIGYKTGKWNREPDCKTGREMPRQGDGTGR